MSEPHLPVRWAVPALSDRLTPDLGPEGPGYPGSAPVKENEESLLALVLNFLGIVRRNLLLVLLTTGAAGAFVAYKIKHERPVFRAGAVIRITDRSPLTASAATPTGAPGAQRIITNSVLLSQIQILQSRGVAADVVKRVGLRLRGVTRGLPDGVVRDMQVPDSVGNGKIRLTFGPTSYDVAGFGERLRAPYNVPLAVHGVQFAIAWKPPTLATAELSVVPADQATAEVAAHLRGTQRPNTDIIDVTYEDFDDYRAQATVNAAVQAFQDMDARSAKQASIRRREFIQQQLDKTQVLLNEAELARGRFESQKQVATVKGSRVQQADVSGVTARHAELQAERNQLAQFLSSTPSTLVPGGRDRLSVLMSSMNGVNPGLSQAYTQLAKAQAARDSLVVGGRSVQDPDVRRTDVLIASSDSTMIRALRAQLASIDTRIVALDELTNRAVEQIASAPASQVEEVGLESQAETYRHQADALRVQLQTAQVDEAAQAGQIEIVDLATAANRISDQRASRFAIAIVIGLALGAMLGFIRENHSPVIRRRDELERLAPVPNLAMVPQIRSMRRGLFKFGSAAAGNGSRSATSGMELVTLSDAKSTGAEAYRTLRTNLLFSSAVQSLKLVVVTSAGPKEGKSTTTANLAITFAQQGNRVLIVDCDLRRPRIHKMFKRNTSPGLTDVLVGTAVIADCIHRTTVEQLFVLTAGTPPPNPSELLGSKQMRAFLDDVGQTFDMVILDTPPLLAASDAAILGRIADGTLVVVRAGLTQRAAIVEGIQQLEKVGARILGTVLNDPDAEVAKYAPYYQYYYNNYYDYSSRES
jgi:capsular exopolysaccharide synthesis family protein